jgi:hypothetical protein
VANRTIRTPEKKAAFLDALAEGASVTKAASAAGLGRTAAYAWREDDEGFKAEWDSAVEAGTDVMEDEALRRAVNGVSKPVFHKGTACGYVQEYSDTLMIFMLKARRPDKYKDRAAVESDNTVRIISSEPMSEDDWQAKYGDPVATAEGSAKGAG